MRLNESDEAGPWKWDVDGLRMDARKGDAKQTLREGEKERKADGKRAQGFGSGPGLAGSHHYSPHLAREAEREEASRAELVTKGYGVPKSFTARCFPYLTVTVNSTVVCARCYSCAVPLFYLPVPPLSQDQDLWPFPSLALDKWTRGGGAPLLPRGPAALAGCYPPFAVCSCNYSEPGTVLRRDTGQMSYT